MHKILIIFGTRPELIKLAPVIYEFDRRGFRDNLIIINTNQHNSLLKQVLGEFSIATDHMLDINNQSNSLSILAAEITKSLENLIKKIQLSETIESIIVQGDTTSTYCASLVAFYNKIPVHYIEAGLRTYDKENPFPEEFHRRVVSLSAEYLYAPTESAKQNLEDEGFDPQKIIVTGNTIIDSIFLMEKLNFTQKINDVRNTILCTIHRRDNHGKNLVNYLESIIKLAIDNSEYNFVILRHPNPEIKNILDKYSVKQSKNLIISDPLPYSKMLHQIKSSRLIISDSGGLLEEASFFQTPVIVLRKTTERVESISNNIAVCLQSNDHNINSIFNKMIALEIDESNKYLYGTGRAAKAIVDNILRPTKNIVHSANSANNEDSSNK
jgi:UDP-N-acetylglucosamine 2-epimerase